MRTIDKIIHAMKTGNLPSNYWINPSIKLLELEANKTVIQRNGQTVWEHTMSVIDLLSVKTDITLLSGLFHDLGKKYVSQIDDSFLHSSSRFPGHSIKSADIAKIRLAEWETTPYVIDRVIRLISTHMFDIKNARKEKTIRNFIASVGKDNIDNWFVLRIADSRSYASQQKYQNVFINPFRRAVLSYLRSQPSLDQPMIEESDQIGSIQIKGGDSK